MTGQTLRGASEKLRLCFGGSREPGRVVSREGAGAVLGGERPSGAMHYGTTGCKPGSGPHSARVPLLSVLPALPSTSIAHGSSGEVCGMSE